MEKTPYHRASRLLVGCLVILTSVTSGCGDESRRISSAVLSTNVAMEPVVMAVETALKISGYRLNEHRGGKETGDTPGRDIHGERYGMSTAFGPALVRIHIVVTPLEKGSQIRVEVIPPRGAYGNSALPLSDYQYALSQVLPDLTVKSTKVPDTWF
jgi:hypothetical protein